MDLVVNGPLKAIVRKERCAALLGYFQSFKADFWRAKSEGKPQPRFNPPKPRLHEGIAIVLKAIRARFTEPDFVRSLKKSFVTVGLAPYEDSKYLQYTLDVSKKAPLADVEEQFRLSEAATELDLISRRDGTEDEESASDCEGVGEE